MTELIRRHPGIFLTAILLLHLALHLPFIHLPPCSIHVWRQCNTLAVARNFFEEDNNIFTPRVDKRLDTDGVTGMQFPAFEWGLAQVYRLTGEHYPVQRGYSLLISGFTLVFVYYFFRKYMDDAVAGIMAAWMCCWSPEWFYHGMNALPDILAFMCGAGALAAFMKWREIKKRRYAIITMLLITLAGLIKIQYGILGTIMGMLLLNDFLQKSIRGNAFTLWIFSGLLSAITVLGWYRYANLLIVQSGLHDFVLQLRPVDNAGEALIIFQRNLISDLPELLLNYSGFMFLLTGLIVFFKERDKRSWIVLPAVLLFIIWYLLMMEQMRVHQYYLLPLLFLCLFPMVRGSLWIIRKRQSLLTYGLLLLMPLLAAARILPARWMKEDLGIPAAFADASQLKLLTEAVPSGDKVITVPDQSGCIWLYFLHKKGFSYADNTLFMPQKEAAYTEFEKYKSAGARWVYMPTGFLPQEHPVMKTSLRHHTSTGGISVYRIN